MRPLVAVLLLSTVTLAGCSNGDDGSFVPEACEDAVLCDADAFFADHHCNVHDVRPRIYAPDAGGPDGAPTPWIHGDSWTYSLHISGQDHGTTRLIYYDDQDGGAHYMVGTPTRNEALQHAIFSTNPVIGRIHAVLYSPHESGSHADMFRFPLCEGSSWSDVFFGTDFTFTAHLEPLTLPDGRQDDLSFRIDGVAADGSTVTHTYSPLAKWFTRIDLNRADGNSVDMELTSLSTGYSGQAFFLRGQKDEFITFTDASDQANAVTRENGVEGPYDTVGIYIDVNRTAGNGRVEVIVSNAAGQQVACAGIDGQGVGGNSDCPEAPLLLEVPYSAGTWQVDVNTQLLTSTQATGEVRLVSIYDRSGRV